MKSKWHIFHRRLRSPFYVDLYTRSLTRDYVFSGLRPTTNLYYVDQYVFMIRKEFLQKRKEILNKIKVEPDYILKLIKEHYRIGETSNKVWGKIGKKDLSAYSNKQLISVFKEYRKAHYDYWPLGIMPLFVESDLTVRIEEEVKNKFPEKANSIIQTFFKPLKEGITSEEYESFLRIAILPDSKQKEALKKHKEKFCWMKNQTFTHNFFDLEYYKYKLQEIKGVDAKKLLDEYKKQIKKHHEDFKKNLELFDNDFQVIVKILNEAIYYRSWRGEQPYKASLVTKNMLKEIASRLEISIQDLMYLVADEVEDMLKNNKNPDAKIISTRKKGYAYIPQEFKILIGKDLKDWKDKFQQEVHEEKNMEGRVAYQGRVTGTCSIVKELSDLKKVRDQSILVTRSTTPAYVSVLNKVIAIVTEEGGVLSHASIISREMKIPCIIGVRGITDVLKDGDKIEVDAEKGIVKKLN